jgi:hypothetical protein
MKLRVSRFGPYSFSAVGQIKLNPGTEDEVIFPVFGNIETVGNTAQLKLTMNYSGDVEGGTSGQRGGGSVAFSAYLAKTTLTGPFDAIVFDNLLLSMPPALAPVLGGTFTYQRNTCHL